MRRGPLQRAFPLPLLLLFLALASALGGVALDLPLRARFLLSRRALASAAAEVRAGSVPQVPARIGLFEVQEIDVGGGAVRFIAGVVMSIPADSSTARKASP